VRAALLCLTLCLLACEREPAIVIRFEPQDLAGRDLSRPQDLAGTRVDAATPVEAATKSRAKGDRECQKDADCVVVADDCCDCKSGGRQHAQHKASPRPNRTACADVLCTAMMSPDASCGKKPACVAHACILK
jgi:hypothetical protein